MKIQGHGVSDQQKVPERKNLILIHQPFHFIQIEIRVFELS